jgi:hypothetical protein
MQSNAGDQRSQGSTDDSPLNFAPFMVPEPSQFDYNPTIYDSLLPPMSIEWDMDNTWMPSFALDPWASSDSMWLPADDSVEYGEGNLNDYDDASVTYQQ